MSKYNVLFVCTHNANRSQIAEAMLRAQFGDYFNAYSAGTERTSVNPRAVAALAQFGIDASAQTSKHIDDLAHIPMDYVITVCNSAKEACPYLPARIKNIHHKFNDPSKVKGREAKVINAYLQACIEIGAWIEVYFGELVSEGREV